MFLLLMSFFYEQQAAARPKKSYTSLIFLINIFLNNSASIACQVLFTNTRWWRLSFFYFDALARLLHTSLHSICWLVFSSTPFHTHKIIYFLIFFFIYLSTCALDWHFFALSSWTVENERNFFLFMCISFFIVGDNKKENFFYYWMQGSMELSKHF